MNSWVIPKRCKYAQQVWYCGGWYNTLTKTWYIVCDTRPDYDGRSHFSRRYYTLCQLHQVKQFRDRKADALADGKSGEFCETCREAMWKATRCRVCDKRPAVCILCEDEEE
jgi:hypothetical protein